MGIFYERKESSDKIEIIYKYNLLYYLLLLLAVILGSLFNLFFYALIIVAFITVVYMVDLLKPSREVKKAMKKRKVEITGSKYSFSNPTRVIIKK